MRFIFGLMVFLSLGLTQAYAGGVAMHGEPMLADDFQHFAYANPNAPKGGVIRHGQLGSFDSLVHDIVKGKPAINLELSMGRLMARHWDEPFSLYPWIAKKIDMAEDRLSMTIHLDERAIFSDGEPITADDILFTIDILSTKGRPNARNVYGNIDTITKRDDLTVDITLKDTANREIAMIISMLPVYAEHVWRDKEFDKTTLEPYPSSGPYMIKDVQPGRKITYERIKNYWAKDIPSLKGQHNFDDISYGYYRDETVLIQAFKAGEFDFRREGDMSNWQTSYDDLDTEKFIKEEIKHQRPEWVHGFIFNTRKDLFAEVDVRKALSFAFDFDWVNNTLFNGAYRRTKSIFPNSMLANPDIGSVYETPETGEEGRKALRIYLKRAGDMLLEAGYLVKSGNRMLKDGVTPMTFEILLQDSAQEKIALNYAQKLRLLGITASIRTVDSAQFFARLNDFDYDMVLYKWHSTLSPGNEQDFYWGSKFADQKGSRNYAAIRDQDVDQAVQDIANALHYDALIEAAHRLDKAIMMGYYFVPLYYHGYDKIAYSAAIKRPNFLPLYGSIVESWWHQEETK